MAVEAGYNSRVEDAAAAFLIKAEQSLVGAKSEWDNGRYDNCANRCYYAAFQAAISALLRYGVRPAGPKWEHSFVQARFAGDLIGRRKLYPSELRDVLGRLLILRQVTDYEVEAVTRIQGYRACRNAQKLVETVRGGGGMGQ